MLSAVRRGPLGVISLNQILQEALNPPRPGGAEVRVGAEAFRPGDRVMQVKNNYDKMVFNGDIGLVTAVDPKDRVVEVHYADRDEPAPVVYESADLHSSPWRTARASTRAREANIPPSSCPSRGSCPR